MHPRDGDAWRAHRAWPLCGAGSTAAGQPGELPALPAIRAASTLCQPDARCRRAGLCGSRRGRKGGWGRGGAAGGCCGYVWLRAVRDELLRAAVHQLRQREATGAVPRPRATFGAGRVRTRGDNMVAPRLPPHRRPSAADRGPSGPDSVAGRAVSTGRARLGRRLLLLATQTACCLPSPARTAHAARPGRVYTAALCWGGHLLDGGLCAQESRGSARQPHGPPQPLLAPSRKAAWCTVAACRCCCPTQPSPRC